MTIREVTGGSGAGPAPAAGPGQFPAVMQVEAYWMALAAAAGGVPGRNRLDPRGIETALSHAFLLERMAPRMGRFRLAGAILSGLMGMDVRGMPLTALFVPPARDRACDALEAAFDRPARVTLDLGADPGPGCPPLAARMVLLPLSDDEGGVARLLGAIEVRGSCGRPPRRLEVAGMRVVPVPAPARSGAAWGYRCVPAPPVTSGLADRAADYVPGTAAERRRALRVIQGGA